MNDNEKAIAGNESLPPAAGTEGRNSHRVQDDQSATRRQGEESGIVARKGKAVVAALYARVSTTNHGQDSELQLTELREYAARRGWETTEYTDTGVSGSKDSRPALNRLMADAKRRKFDTVIVWKLDRLGRSLRHLVNTLAEFEAMGISFISLRDNLDLSTPSGRLMFQIIGAMAEFERALIQERVRAGMANARRKGKQLGRPRTAVDTARAATLRSQGLSWRAVARVLGQDAAIIYRAVAAQAAEVAA